MDGRPEGEDIASPNVENHGFRPISPESESRNGRRDA